MKIKILIKGLLRHLIIAQMTINHVPGTYPFKFSTNERHPNRFHFHVEFRSCTMEQFYWVGLGSANDAISLESSCNDIETRLLLQVDCANSILGETEGAYTNNESSARNSKGDVWINEFCKSESIDEIVQVKLATTPSERALDGAKPLTQDGGGNSSWSISAYVDEDNSSASGSQVREIQLGQRIAEYKRRFDCPMRSASGHWEQNEKSRKSQPIRMQWTELSQEPHIFFQALRKGIDVVHRLHPIKFEKRDLKIRDSKIFNDQAELFKFPGCKCNSSLNPQQECEYCALHTMEKRTPRPDAVHRTSGEFFCSASCFANQSNRTLHPYDLHHFEAGGRSDSNLIEWGNMDQINVTLVVAAINAGRPSHYGKGDSSFEGDYLWSLKQARLAHHTSRLLTEVIREGHHRHHALSLFEFVPHKPRNINSRSHFFSERHHQSDRRYCKCGCQ